jgi:hypothetical protein
VIDFCALTLIPKRVIPHLPQWLNGLLIRIALRTSKIGLEARVRSLPPSYLTIPVAGEVYEDVQLCRERLQGWALSQGFAIVQKGGGEGEAKPRFRFRCIHHANDTMNTRQLERHVKRDEQGDMTTRRKQEAISINARDCSYLIELLFK